ncbi:hypothetical protein HG531_007064 [Fusarium graminearum]|nr:hypothetical protein HG531_007064 [Fusarium graminearum]
MGHEPQCLSVRLSAGIIVDAGGCLGAKAKHVKERAPPLLLGAGSSVLIVVHDGATALLEGLGGSADHDLELKVLNVVVGLYLCAAAVGEAGARVEDVASEGAGEGDYYGALLAGNLQGLLGERLGETLANPVRMRDDGMEEDDLGVTNEVSSCGSKWSLLGNALLPIGILVDGLADGQGNRVVSLGSINDKTQPAGVFWVNDSLEDRLDVICRCF